MSVINENMDKIIALNELKNQSNNVIAITHSMDLDGFSSAAIIKLKYPNAKLIGYNYNEPFKLDVEDVGKPIIMADVSMPMDKMKKLGELSNNQFTYIDHHKSAIEDYYKFISENGNFCTAVLEDGISACEGTWKHLFPDKKMPEAILLLGEYDIWRKKNLDRWGNKILPFQFGMRVLCNSPESFPTYLFDDKQEDVDRIIENGKIVLKYQSQVNEQQCKGAFEYEFEGLRAICLNGGNFNSEAFKSVYDESKHDIMMPFKFDGKQWIVSFYTTKDNIDCSAIAKKYGGGGHKGAAGAQFKTIHDIFKNINI